MVKLKLIPYVLRIKNEDLSKRKKPVFEDLIKFNFGKLFQDFVNSPSNIIVDADADRVFNCYICQHDPKQGIYYGIVGCGDFGYSSKIIHTDTRKITKEKEVKEAEIIPFYFLLKVFKTYAVLLLNKFKQRGTATAFQKQLKKYLDSKKIFANKFVILFNPAVSDELINANILHKVRFIRKANSKDIEGLTLNEDGEQLIDERVFHLNGPVEKFMRHLKLLIKNYKEAKYIEIESKKYDKIRLEVKMHDGSSKVIKLSDVFKFNEGIIQEFEGDFPKLEKFYETAQPYFIRVMRGLEIE